MKSILIAVFGIYLASFIACSSTTTSLSNNVTVEASPLWDQHPEYLDKLLGRIATRWKSQITMNDVWLPAGTAIHVTINIYSDGGEPEPVSIKGGYGKPQRACARALRKGTDEWTPEMINTLGTRQELTFTFVFP